MSEKSPEKQSSVQTSFVEDSPVKTSPPQERELDSTESGAGSGLSLPASLASYDPDSLSWRTSQRSVFGGWAPFSDRDWPRSGILLCGIAYPLPPSAPLTGATGGSVLPTPTAQTYGSNQGGAAGRTGKVRHSLQSMAKRNKWPTPTAGDSRGSGSRNTANSKAHAGISLTDAVRGDGGKGRTWPTPLASDGAKDASGSLARVIQTGHPKGRLDGTLRKGRTWPTPRVSMVNGPASEEIRAGDPKRRLETAVVVWPTPCATDWKSGYSAEGLARQLEKRAKPLRDMAATGGRLNPAWVEALMGFPPGFTEVE